MKALLYLAGLAVVIILALWLGFGLAPAEQWQRVKAYTTQTSSKISEQISDTKHSAEKLKSNLDTRFEEAADVYNNSQTQKP